jgi:hypothetical protein
MATRIDSACGHLKLSKCRTLRQASNYQGSWQASKLQPDFLLSVRWNGTVVWLLPDVRKPLKIPPGQVDVRVNRWQWPTRPLACALSPSGVCAAPPRKMMWCPISCCYWSLVYWTQVIDPFSVGRGCSLLDLSSDLQPCYPGQTNTIIVPSKDASTCISACAWIQFWDEATYTWSAPVRQMQTVSPATAYTARTWHTCVQLVGTLKDDDIHSIAVIKFAIRRHLTIAFHVLYSSGNGNLWR